MANSATDIGFGAAIARDPFKRLLKLPRGFAGPYFFAHGFEALVALGVR